MRLFFHCNQLSVRGTEVATYDYAYYNQTLLNNESVVVYPKDSPSNNPLAVEKFSKQFELIAYDRFSDVEGILAKRKADAMYVMNSGFFDGIVSHTVPNLIHAVFPVWPNQRYGDVYAFISNWLSKECANDRLPFVPYIVSLPGVGTATTLRDDLGIPADAFVVGCVASRQSFDIPFVKAAVRQAVERRLDLYFVFLNIDSFADHERMRFLPAQTDMEFKAKFIATCDAMLHARKRGETFGLACAEFSIANKPVLTYAYSPEVNHLEVLGEKAIVYRGQKELARWLLNADRNELSRGDWDAYSKDYAPVPVMGRFRAVFLDPASRHTNVKFSVADWAAVGGYALGRNARKVAGKVLRRFD
jgi:hypothetical protein